MEGENFAPTYLRVNSKGTVPSLVVPIGVTTGQEVDTKFRALNGSIEIANFLGR
jgi:glutathione S-transferase